MDRLFENYRNLMAKIDRFCREAEEAYGKELTCRKGCSSCCRHISLFPVEAVHIRIAMEDLDEKTVEKIRQRAMKLLDDPDGECPLLVEGICLLYPSRPVICRTHGLPVLVRREEGTTVDCCPFNFTSGAEPDPLNSLDIEQLNTTLVTVNGLFVKQAFDEAGDPGRLLLAEALLMDFE